MEKTFTLKAGEIQLRVSSQGPAPQAVFVHGMAGDLHGWDSLLAALGPEFPALRYDLRGFGESEDSGDVPFSHSDDLISLLDALELPQADLIGVSMGGAIALNTALTHPERVRRLVLISPAIAAWEWSDAWKAQFRPIMQAARAGDLQTARALWFQHPMFAPLRESLPGEAYRASLARFSGRQWARDHQKPVLPDVDRLSTLQVPTLLLSGGRDFADFRLIADVLTAAVPHLTRVDLPERGHLLYLEDPAGTAARILEFLA